MNAVIPTDHPLRKIWLSTDSGLVQSKCLMRMRMKDSYRDVSPSCVESFYDNANFIATDGLQSLPKHDPIPPRNDRWEEAVFVVK